MAESQASGSEESVQKKHQDVETQNLEKVTDYVEEAGNSEELGKVYNLSMFFLLLFCFCFTALG